MKVGCFRSSSENFARALPNPTGTLTERADPVYHFGTKFSVPWTRSGTV